MRGGEPHILVVDDDMRLRELLKKYLSENGFRVTTAGDASDARAKIRSLTFDLIILDIMMPGESGVELTSSLRRTSNVPILFISAMGEVDDRIAGLESGGDDYLTKPFEPRELLTRARTILRRAPPEETPPEAVDFGGFHFDIARGELRKGDRFLRLTSAETNLLAKLAMNAGSPVPREDLCRNGGVNASARNIDVQVTRLRRKIEADPKNPRYLQTVRGTGYLLRID